MFKKETYIHRRDLLKKSVGKGLVLLLGNSDSPMNFKDNIFHFRQDSSFLYYFGLNRPDLVGLIDCDSGEEWIYGNDFTVEDFVWMGSQESIQEQSAEVGVTDTGNLNQLGKKLASEKSRKIHFLAPYRPENKLKLFNWLGLPPKELESKRSVELVKSIVAQRNYKTEEEITEIIKAANTSVDMHMLAMRMAKPHVFEAQIAGAVQEVAVAAGGQLSFPVIATINGQILHNHDHSNVLKDGDLFLLDAGAETSMGYAADLSSTIPVSGRFSERQREVYSICLDSHNQAIDMLKPGVSFKEIHLQAARTIANGLKDLGLMKGNIDEAVQNGAHALFFPCGLGHMMGLDVHDMEDLGEVFVGYDGQDKSTAFGLKSLRLGRKLEPGFVITIEPGIYFIPELIDQWKAASLHSNFINYKALEKFRNFGGIRNEEDFLITEQGSMLLGKQKPKTINEVEAEWAKGI